MSTSSRHGLALGLDIAEVREHAFAVLDDAGRVLRPGTVPHDRERLLEVAAGVGPIGIDSPRMLVTSPRTHRWNEATSAWIPHQAKSLGSGRHCEIVLRALGLANPKWTPAVGRKVPGWIRRGIDVFTWLADREVYEVFPTASLGVVTAATPITFDLRWLRDQRHDVVDAILCAWTARELAAGRGCEVGGGDGLGTIGLPAVVAVPSAIAKWPAPAGDGLSGWPSPSGVDRRRQPSRTACSPISPPTCGSSSAAPAVAGGRPVVGRWSAGGRPVVSRWSAGGRPVVGRWSAGGRGAGGRPR